MYKDEVLTYIDGPFYKLDSVHKGKFEMFIRVTNQHGAIEVMPWHKEEEAEPWMIDAIIKYSEIAEDKTFGEPVVEATREYALRLINAELSIECVAGSLHDYALGFRDALNLKAK